MLGTAVTFEEEPPDPTAFAARIEQIACRYAFLVAELDDEVVGYAYGTRHRERPAYRWVSEVSVYVRSERRRRGVGSSLYGALLPLLSRQGLRVALAGITLPNPESVALHERCGFRAVGVYRGIGFKSGAWRDVGWWQLRLGEDDAPPAEPRPPVALHPA